jgi:hypothetical protein
VPLQLVSGEGHAQEPPLHVVPPLHAFPQVPQLLSSFWRSAQEPEHSVGAEAGHPLTQPVPPSTGAHTGVAPLHDAPHAPQLPWVERSTSQPSARFVEQCAKPGSQV